MREFAGEPERQIVGVVADTRDGGLNNDPRPMMFIPQAQVPDPVNALNVRLTPMAWVVRTQTEPLSMSNGDPGTAAPGDGTAGVGSPLDVEVVSDRCHGRQFNMWLMTVFGFSALLLAAIGIYGLMAYSVEQRTQEIGIRLALGARAVAGRDMVVRQGMRLAIVGVAIGLAAAFGLARFIAIFLFGVDMGPCGLRGRPGVLALVTLIAVWLPASRASRVDPILALR